ncbi:hypothetical protein FOA52_006456 [Chlamydomonas sp. UWO 241]|nr:hypothetical protein FOA52_006456 [Chlamydomonas sp. UWO 241]
MRSHDGFIQARFAADRGQMITIVSAYSPTEAASDEEAGDFYLRVAALADKANDKRDLLIVADGVLKAMTESFDKLYGGETKLSDETLNQLENDVAAFELTRATEVDEAHGRPPDLAETEACVRALRSAAAPGGDQLDAMLLRCPPAIAWLHRVIIAVWRSGRTPREWKTAIITP